MSFKQLEGDTVVIQENGVYTVHDLYERADGSLWAQVGNKKFIRLKANGSTSKAKGHIDVMETEKKLYQDRFGRLCITDALDRKPVKTEDSTKLLQLPSYEAAAAEEIAKETLAASENT